MSFLAAALPAAAKAGATSAAAGSAAPSALSSFTQGAMGGGGISGLMTAADALKAGEYSKLAGSAYAMGDEANKQQANPYRDIYNIYKRF